jgi:hypothetical protein
VTIARLSDHLTVSEFIGTSHRELIGEQERLWNGDAELQARARRFAAEVFEPCRGLVGPLHVNSGFRCPALNQVVGGAPKSRHMLGLAADVVPVAMPLRESFDLLARLAAAGALPHLDKIIIEMSRWLHVQGAEQGQEPRHLALITDDTKVFRRATA